MSVSNFRTRLNDALFKLGEQARPGLGLYLTAPVGAYFTKSGRAAIFWVKMIL